MAAAIKLMAELGFGPTMFELRGTVQDYVHANDFATTFQDGMPGYDWNISYGPSQSHA